MDERNHGLLPDDMAEELENIGYDSSLYTVNREGIVQVRGFEGHKTETDRLFEMEFGMSQKVALSKFGEFVNEFMAIRKEKKELQTELEGATGENSYGINDRLYEIQRRIDYIISLHTQLLKRSGFEGSEDEQRFMNYIHENGWF